LDLLDRRVAGDDRAKGLLLFDGDARPLVREPIAFLISGEVVLTFALSWITLRGAELLFELFFFKLLNMLVFEKGDGISRNADGSRRLLGQVEAVSVVKSKKSL
jgi:hypothetical protein